MVTKARLVQERERMAAPVMRAVWVIPALAVALVALVVLVVLAGMALRETQVPQVA